jgi:hypothetical protein
MRRSIPILDNEDLVAVAALGDFGWFLIAIDPRLEDLDRQNFADHMAAERVARAHLRRNWPHRPDGTSSSAVPTWPNVQAVTRTGGA